MIDEQPIGESKLEKCAICDDEAARLSYQIHAFNYGPIDDGVVLHASVPVWTCESCGEAYLGEEAEEIMHEAVCLHLGRLTPREIKAMRVSFGMRQEEFAEMTGHGIASIKRWESGAQIPSRSADQHLRFYRSMGVEEARKRTRPRPEPEFTTAFDADTLARARRFQLRPPIMAEPEMELAA